MVLVTVVTGACKQTYDQEAPHANVVAPEYIRNDLHCHLHDVVGKLLVAPWLST